MQLVQRHRPLVLCLAFALITSCGGAGMESYTPVDEKTKFGEDQLFGATERAIEKLGYQPTNKDRESYRIETREKEVGYSSVPRLFYKYSFVIETAGGKLSIRSNCRKNSAMARDEFEDCGDERPERVLEEQGEIHQTILEIAATLPSTTFGDE